MIIFRWIIILVVLPTVAAAGEIYQCTAADGSKTFQATPCPDNAKEDRRKLQSAASDSRSASRGSASTNDGADSPATSCRNGVLKDYEDVPKEIEAYYKKRKRQCRESFHDGSFQIKNCYQEQEEIRAKKYEDLEIRKERMLASCES